MNFISYYTRKFKIILSKYFERPISFIEEKKIKQTLKNSDSIILIFSIGKVGSASVHKSLSNVKELGMPVFHLHSLNPDRIKNQEKYYRSSERKSVPLHLIKSKILTKYLSEFSGQIYIWTLIREPILREISSLFQDSFNFFKSKKFLDEEMKGIIEKKLQSLTASLPEEKWFQFEMNDYFGIDINSLDFNPNIGFALTNKEHLRVAFVRLENLNNCFNTVCQNLFCAKYNFKLITKNRSDDKFYADLYSNLKIETKIKKEKIDRVIQSDFIQKFYPDYIEVIRKRWQIDYKESNT